MNRLKPPVPIPRCRAAVTARCTGPLRSAQFELPPLTFSQGVTLLVRWCRPRETRVNQAAVSFMSPRICASSGAFGGLPDQ